jgi:hypothetical protein
MCSALRTKWISRFLYCWDPAIAASIEYLQDVCVKWVDMQKLDAKRIGVTAAMKARPERKGDCVQRCAVPMENV